MKFISAALAVLLLSLAPTAHAAKALKKIHVYKSPTCGCCTKWEEHLQANGFTVESEKVADVAAIKAKHGVPSQLSSCHTGLIDGYVVEGHVPADTIKKLLKQKPKGITGITVPGMPIGSPGMEQGNIVERYEILTFDKSGKTTVFERR